MQQYIECLVIFRLPIYHVPVTDPVTDLEISIDFSALVSGFYGF